MTNTQLALVALKASIALTVFAVGLEERPGDLLHVARQPGLFARSFGSMYLAMPLTALWMALVLPLHPAVKVGLVALSVSPVPPLLPGKAAKSGADSSFASSLFVTSCVLSIVTVPAALWLLGVLLGPSMDPGTVTLTKLIGTGVLLPLFAGLAVKKLSARIAALLDRPVHIAATAGLALGVVLLLSFTWRPMLLLFGDGTIIAIAAFTAIGLATGHLLGGPRGGDRRVLALATASRHPAIAIAVATALMPSERLAPAAVLLTMIVGAIATRPYLLRSKPVQLVREVDDHRESLRPIVRAELTQNADRRL